MWLTSAEMMMEFANAVRVLATSENRLAMTLSTQDSNRPPLAPCLDKEPTSSLS